MKMDCILIDASHLLYRSWHSFKDFENKDKSPTGIHFGVMRAIEHLAKVVPNAYMVFCLDGACDKRKELYPEYKAGRGPSESHADIIHEFGMTMDICELVKYAGCAVARHPDYEADDLIAMLALQPTKYMTPASPDMDRIIYSGDDDFCQLVGQHVQVLKPPAGKAHPERWMNIAQVLKEWQVHPESLALYRSFTGDSGDNIKGLPRVTRDRLQAAVENKKTPSDFYDGDGLAHFNPDWGRKLTEFRSQCEMNYRLTKLPWEFADNLTIEFNECGLDIVKLESLFEKLEFSSFLNKLGAIQENLGPRSYASSISLISNRSEPGPNQPQRMEGSVTGP